MTTTSFDGVSDEERTAFAERVRVSASEEVMKVIVEQLSDEDFQMFITPFETGSLTPDDEARLIDEAAQKIPNFPEKLSAAFDALHAKLVVRTPEPTAL